MTLRTIVLAAAGMATGMCYSQFGPEQIVYQPAANAPVVLLMADLDGNGYADAIAFSDNDQRVVWFPNDGEGQCGPRRDIGNTTPMITVMDAADLDGDGDLDLITSNGYSPLISWFRNDGAGNFGPRHTVTDELFTMSDVHAVDVDEDGDLDMLVAGPGRFVWFPNDGTGNFGAMQILLGNGNSPSIAMAADMDGDGHVDLCTVSAGKFLWLRNAGGGVISDTTIITVMNISPEAIAIADLDGDGDLDVAAANSCMRTAWYPNDGSGGFPTQMSLSSGSGGSCPGTVTLVAGDLDGDGDIDLAFGTSKVTAIPANYGVRSLLNDGNGTFTSSPPFFFASNDENYLTGIWIGQLNDDPATEVVLAYSDNAIFSYTYAGMEAFYPFSLLQQISGTTSRVGLVGTGDLNGDGFLDLVTSVTTDYQLGTPTEYLDSRVFWQAGDGQGNFGPPVVIAQGWELPSYLKVADADGDGDLDVFYSFLEPSNVYWCENDGTGAFTVQLVGEVLFQGFGDVGDMDGDGDLDVVVPKGNAVALYTLDAGVYNTMPTTIATGTVNCSRIHLVDLDGDGDLDMTYVSSTTYRVMNQGGGVFSAPENLASIPGGSGFADIDGDGDMDLVSGNGAWYANDGAGNFGTSQFIGGGGGTIEIADVNNDGRPDLLFIQDNPDRVGWCENIDGGQAWVTHLINTNYNMELNCITSGDVDGDGDVDLFTGSEDHSHVSMYKNYSTSAYTITGRVFVDEDGNGVEDGNDNGAAFAAITCAPSPAFEFMEPDGNYVIATGGGPHQISFDGAPLWQVTTDSLVYHADLSPQQPVRTGVDFGIQATVDSSDVVLSFTSGQGVCGTAILQWVDITNAGTRQEHGYVAVELDSLYTLISTYPIADSTVGRTSYWDIGVLDHFEHVRIRLNVLSPTFEHIGDTVTTHAMIQLQDELGNATGVVSTSGEGIVSCSYDPNDKTALPLGAGEYETVFTPVPYLDYTIRFQNTGTAAAETVVLIDPLSQRLVPASLQVIGYSHVPSEVRIEADGTLIVRFQGIQLPPIASDTVGSQGFFRFRIKPRTDLPAVATVENTANILFDTNPPVVTNTTLRTLVDCSAFNASITQTGIDLLEASSGASYQWRLNGTAIPGATSPTFLADAPGSYTVEVVSAYGCHAVSDAYVVITLAVAEIDGFRMVLVPDPMKETGRLIFNSPIGPEARIDLYDMSGRIMQTLRGNGSHEVTINRKGISSGLYVVRLSRADARPISMRIAVE